MTPLVTEETIFGYDLKDGRYTINRNEASIVVMTFYVYVVCKLSHQQIAFHFNRLHVDCPEERWTDQLVHSILTNPAYIGRDGCPDILQDIEAFEQAQQ